MFLGGIEVPYVKGLLGHSDGDALLHAICDALLGAMGQGDIGEHFPDTDPKYCNISSVQLLEEVMGVAVREKFQVVNIDTVIIAQEPALCAFKEKMRQKIAGLLNVKEDCVGIKAKTNEGMGETGRKEAIACYAVALLAKGE